MARPAPSKTRSPLLPFYVILGVVAVAGVAWLVSQRGGGGGAAAVSPVPTQIDSSVLARTQGISLGDPNAPVVIFEFADFQCPACATFARFTTPLIKDPWVANGTVRMVFFDFPITGAHPNAFLAARAARCANEQDRFWDYHDLLYGRQSEWSTRNRPVDFFVDMATQLGLNESQFAGCLRSDKYAAEVTQSMMFGETMGVGGTPTLFINGRRMLEIPLTAQDLEAVIRAELGNRAPAAAAPAAPAADTAPADGTAAPADSAAP